MVTNIIIMAFHKPDDISWSTWLAIPNMLNYSWGNLATLHSYLHIYKSACELRIWYSIFLTICESPPFALNVCCMLMLSIVWWTCLSGYKCFIMQCIGGPNNNGNQFDMQNMHEISYVAVHLHFKSFNSQCHTYRLVKCFVFYFYCI